MPISPRPSLSAEISPLPETTLQYYGTLLEEEIHSLLIDQLERATAEFGIRRKEIACRLRKTPGVITRSFREPRNLTIRTISDLIAAMGVDPRSVLAKIRAPKPREQSPSRSLVLVRDVPDHTEPITGIANQETQTPRENEPMAAAALALRHMDDARHPENRSREMPLITPTKGQDTPRRTAQIYRTEIERAVA